MGPPARAGSPRPDDEVVTVSAAALATPGALVRRRVAALVGDAQAQRQQQFLLVRPELAASRCTLPRRMPRHWPAAEAVS
jgi:hypothetical protein